MWKLMKMIRHVEACGVLVVVLATTSSGSSQTQIDAKVDSYIRWELARQHVPGLALGVYREGKIIRAHGYGPANVELEVLVTPETVFQSGSVASNSRRWR
jgi:CubicO group peptidase (beta-lactamase class C family)